MWKVIANFVWQFLSMESVREFIMDGLKRLVASTDNGIDDRLCCLLNKLEYNHCSNSLGE
jgi:hypothetical protein